MSGTWVVTIVHGRRDHLRRQRKGLLRSTHRPAGHVIVAMDDDLTSADVDEGIPTRILEVDTASEGLPLAAARNRGAQEAIAAGCELMVFLDVDCIPAPELLERYEAAARRHPRALLSGPVTYLPPAGPGGYDLEELWSLGSPHPARPAPATGQVLAGGDHRLFWSLSYAVTPATWDVVGGFDEAYVGYGGEDTDFGQRARAASVDLAWVGGAEAFHQHHGSSRLPVEHVVDVVRNATIFQRRWGWWPMLGWLEAFETRGLVERVGGDWRLSVSGSAGPR